MTPTVFVIDWDSLLAILLAVQHGAEPELLMMEIYANCEIRRMQIEPDDE